MSHAKTLLPSGPELNPQTTVTTNKAFLTAVFSDLQTYERPVVLAVRGTEVAPEICTRR